MIITKDFYVKKLNRVKHKNKITTELCIQYHMFALALAKDVEYIHILFNSLLVQAIEYIHIIYSA